MKHSKTLCLFIMVPVVAVLAAGTIFEKFKGHDWAASHIYGAWWFYLLLAAVGIFVLWSIVSERMWHKPYLFSLYLSVLFVLMGGLLTATTGRSGSLSLHPGVPANSFTTDKGQLCHLPFSLTLDRFEVIPYPGTRSPMDFVSHLSVDGESVDVSMNNIFKRSGFRFYQEDYDDEGNSVLSVSHDPWGIAVTYIGYLFLALGIMLLFVSRSSRFRQLAKGSLPVLLLLSLAAAEAHAAPQTLPRSTADKMGRIYVLYKGRICPMQTLAKDFTTKLCGNARYQGLTPEQVLSGWLFYFSQWADEPMIKVKGDDVHQLLGSTNRWVSYNDLFAHQDAFASPASGAPMAMPPASGSMSKTLRAASEKFNIIQMLLGGKFLKIYPVADSAGSVSWFAQNDKLPLYTPDDNFLFIRKQLGYCQELVVNGDFDQLERVFDKTIVFQHKVAGDVLPPSSRFNAERLYNRLTTGRWLAMLAVSLGLLFFAIAIFRSSSSSRPRNISTHLGAALVLALTLFLILIFSLRWVAGGHIPMAGGFDSMNLTAIAIGVVCVSLARRYPIAPSIGLLFMGFCLLVAMMSGSNPPVTHLMPVLSSPLLTLHVTVIMISYALFFFIALNGLAAIILRRQAAAMQRVSLLMLYPATALLAVGIVIGALWANISWGNYWSWDPKEVWALITLIVYLFPLINHQHNSSPYRFHIYCFIAFLSVIITYFGVNFILGGIHAYN